VRVRAATPADLERCLDLFEAVAAEGRWLASEPPVDRAEVGAGWRDLLEEGPGTLLVADDGGELVGLAALVGRGAPRLGMLVRADRRRAGVGGALLDASLAWARDAGASRVVLTVFPHNPVAIALYRSRGFVETGVDAGAIRRRSGERWDAIRMERVLRDQESASSM
jgi:GNAT superfamily N-acetyltransferase